MRISCLIDKVGVDFNLENAFISIVTFNFSVSPFFILDSTVLFPNKILFGELIASRS